MKKSYQALQPLIVFLFVAMLLQAMPLWGLYISGLENEAQFLRTITVAGLTSLATLALGFWLFWRVVSRLQGQLVASEKMHRELLASISSPVLALDTQMRVQFCNQAFGGLVGVPHDEFTGRRLLDLAPELEQTLSFQACFRVLAHGEPESVSGQFRGRDMEVSIWRTPDGIIGLAKDVTEQRRLETDLAQARQHETELQAIQRTAATAAHEINNPLAAQMLLLQLLQDELAAGKLEEAGGMIEEALEQNKRISQAVLGLQMITKPAYKKYIGETKILDLSTPQGQQEITS